MSLSEEVREKQTVCEAYGVNYYSSLLPAKYVASNDQAYYFEVIIGDHNKNIEVKFGDCIYFLSDDLKQCILKRGPCSVKSLHCATIIRGFMPSDISASIYGTTLLPYINGCSTKQLIHPPRPGDPTLQYLRIPPNTSEQLHHIHSTARVVYVYSGKGKSIVGMNDTSVENELLPGSICILNPMCPHHFITSSESHLEVIPLHIFSSIDKIEHTHPMASGTHLI